MDGRLPVEAFEPADLRRRPHRFSASQPCVEPVAEGLDPVVSGVVYDAEEEATVLERLRALGYLE
jgi:hypothetical protein